MMSTTSKIGIGVLSVLVLVCLAWIFTAPYPGNTGWERFCRVCRE